MPAILERLVKQLQAKGKDKSSAFAIATSTLQKAGDLKPGSQQATSKGAKRGNMTPAARSKDRAVKASPTHKTTDFKYDIRTNRSTLKASPPSLPSRPPGDAPWGAGGSRGDSTRGVPRGPGGGLKRGMVKKPGK